MSILKEYGANKNSFDDFGGIQNYCRQNGVKYYTQQEVKNAYNTINTALICQGEHGYVNPTIMSREYGVKSSAYLPLGGLKHICDISGIEYRRDNRTNPKYILDKAVEYYQKNGSIKKESFIKESKISASAINTAFGTFNKMLDAAGLDRNVETSANVHDVLEDIRRVIEDTGSASSTVYRHSGKYSQPIIERLCGSWCNAIKMIGIQPVNEKHGKDKILKDISSLYKEYGCLSKKIVEDNLPYSYTAVSIAFGGMDGISKALCVNNAFANYKSSGHIMIREILRNDLMIDDIEEEYTFEWLINPYSNRHLYMDFYIPSHNVCIEYQGEQHYVYTKFFHRSEDSFYKSVQRDNIKKSLCVKNGIRLITFDYNDKLTASLVAKRLYV